MTKFGFSGLSNSLNSQINRNFTTLNALKLNNLLLPNGEIFIETSDTVKYLAKDHYKPFHLPDHLSFASEKIIRGIFLRNGYEFVSIKKTPLVKGGLIKLIKETIKYIIPNYESQLIKFVKYRKTDIFLRFRKIK
jgi:hypothetical protein